MTLRFAVSRPDGGVTIISAAPIADLKRVFGPLFTEEQYRAHVIERNGLTDSAVELPEDWTPPDDRTFRDAWRLNGKGLEVDMDRARVIHMGRIRRARDAKLPALDVQFTRAQGRKDAAAADAVEAQRQTLRDLPTTFDLSKASTPDELRRLWPAELA